MMILIQNRFQLNPPLFVRQRKPYFDFIRKNLKIKLLPNFHYLNRTENSNSVFNYKKL